MRLGFVYPVEPASGKFMCVPACLNAIYRRRGLQPISQTDMATRLGLVVPRRLLSSHPGAEPSDDPTQWGVHPQNPATSLNTLFRHTGIALQEQFYPMGTIADELEFIATQLHFGNDVMVGYDYAALFRRGQHVGHAGLVAAIDTTEATVTLLDPEQPDLELVELHALLAAIKAQRDGFWVIGTKVSLAQASVLVI